MRFFSIYDVIVKIAFNCRQPSAPQDDGMIQKFSSRITRKLFVNLFSQASSSGKNYTPDSNKCVSGDPYYVFSEGS